jgi:hypothetical protein
MPCSPRRSTWWPLPSTPPSEVVDPRLRMAVDASLGWYGDLCALYGVPASLEDGLWWSRTSPPPLHSDAVVVEPTVTAGQVLDRLADRPRCGVKDSFATLDLTGGGLRVLFDASWMHLEAPAATSSAAWSRVTSAAELETWTSLHDTTGVLLPGLLNLPHFAVLANYSAGDIVAGAVARLAGGVVDVSNTYAVPGQRLDWSELVGVHHSPVVSRRADPTVRRTRRGGPGMVARRRPRDRARRFPTMFRGPAARVR